MEWGTYIFFAFWVFVMTCYVLFFLPETKGVPIEEMGILWRSELVYLLLQFCYCDLHAAAVGVLVAVVITAARVLQFTYRVCLWRHVNKLATCLVLFHQSCKPLSSTNHVASMLLHQ